MAKKTHIKVRLVPENKPNSSFNYYVKKPSSGEKAKIKIEVYNIHGQLMRVLELGKKGPGLYLTPSQAAYWDGKNEGGEKVSSGIYFYRLIATADESQQKQSAIDRMVLIK